MDNADKLKVVIVGSGLAGLTAARIVREHHDVTVYERGRPDVATGGQGIIIGPNATKVLDSVGYDRERTGAVSILGIRMYNKDLTITEDAEMNLRERFGGDCIALKRSDFRDELMRLATANSNDLGVDVEPTKMVYGTAAVALDPENGVVTLEDGTRVTADVVVIADGIHSRLRSTVVGEERAAKKTGMTCYRLAVSTEDARAALKELPLPHWWDQRTCRNRSSVISAADGTPRVVTVYPLRGETYFNMSLILRTQDSTKETTESWHVDGDRNKMIEAFRDFGEDLKRIISAAAEVKVWELQDLEPLPTWVCGRAMLIGDAAHAMTPMQGQGANMSIEDAESLRLLAPGTRREDVHSILKLAESVRRPRATQVLTETRKSHSTKGVAERVVENMEFHCAYNGIYDALKAKETVNA